MSESVVPWFRNTFRRLFTAVLAAAIFGMAPAAQAQGCACESEQEIRINLRGVGYFAGSITVRITAGENVQTTTMSAGTIGYDSAEGEYYAASFDCAQWESELAVKAKLDQPIHIEYLYVSDPTSPDYTEIGDAGGVNPVAYLSLPGSRCLKFWIDTNDGNWVPYTFTGFSYGPDSSIRLKGTIGTKDGILGDSAGPVAGGNAPAVSPTGFLDPDEVGDLSANCPGSFGFAAFSAGSGGTAAHAAGIEGAPIHIDGSPSVSGYGEGEDAPAPGGFGPLSMQTTPNGYSLSDQIGALRWEMDLGSVGAAYTLGRLVSVVFGRVAADCTIEDR